MPGAALQVSDLISSTAAAQGQGPVATVICKRGTLRPGQPVVVGTEWGKVGPSLPR